MVENIPKMNPQIQEAQFISTRINIKESTSSHIIMKLQNTKGKEKILKAANRRTIRLTADFSLANKTEDSRAMSSKDWQKITIKLKPRTGKTL